MKSSTKNSGISLLNFDHTLKRQTSLRKYRRSEWIDFSDLDGSQSYCSNDSLRKIQKRLKSRKYSGITLIGNGNYHYVTYVLLSEIRHPFSLILFDHHTDLAYSSDMPFISCGSWVSFALKTFPLLNQVMIIGAHPISREKETRMLDKVTIISEQEISRMPTVEIVRTIRRQLLDLPIYISVDKDVLDRQHAVTNWDQGNMSLKQLLDVIRELKRTHTIIGVDICGELPLSPVEFLSDQRVKYLKKNEIANQAIVDELIAG